jgi:phosphoribosylaminoimidazolecarboxamide formyltransferase/IMP cyclohydrolase
MKDLHEIKRALISVANKKELIPLVRKLIPFNIEIISTGGTSELLKEHGIEFTPIEQVTGNPESFGGRMKTISFEVASSILFRREIHEDREQAKQLGISPIDLVICNFYPFEEKREQLDNLNQLIEHIDIGGPTMIRSAAKNFHSVTVLSHPDQYDRFTEELADQKGSTSLALRQSFAVEAFAATARYESVISQELITRSPIEMTGHIIRKNRYGENPHQQALLRVDHQKEQTLANSLPIQGKELGFNNYLDLNAAFSLVKELKKDRQNLFSTVIVKHQNPCGVSSAGSLIESFNLAWQGDSTSAFGSVIGFSDLVDEELAQVLKTRFIECIIAPDYSTEALKILSEKKNLRLLQVPIQSKKSLKQDQLLYQIDGGQLVQEQDLDSNLKLDSKTQRPFPEELSGLASFGNLSTKYLKSNAVSIVAQEKNGALWLVATGMGQPNRLDCIRRLAVPKLQEQRQQGALEKTKYTLIVSDGFFPFSDSIEQIAESQVTHVLQPGGSIRDQEVIQKCDDLGIAMAFTGKRHFRH